jgi:hypothetical protein
MVAFSIKARIRTIYCVIAHRRSLLFKVVEDIYKRGKGYET